MVSFTPYTLPNENNTFIHRDTRFTGLLNQSGQFGEEGNLLPLLGLDTHMIEPLG